MVLGLQRGTVRLVDHQSAWKTIAQETMGQLWRIFGAVALDIQHVGSTSISGIKAKPIIDIAIAVESLSSVATLVPALEAAGFLYRPWYNDDQMLFAVGDYSLPTGIQTHFIHVVAADSPSWRDYINFRDYLNANPTVAKGYEALKLKLAGEHPHDKGREPYLAGKHDFIVQTLRDALVWSYLGKIVTVTVERPIGAVHPLHPDMRYPVNYGYVAGVVAPDLEDLDAYILGVSQPLKSFTGRVIAIVHRKDDIEDKLVVAPAELALTVAKIKEQVLFQERYFQSWVELASHS